MANVSRDRDRAGYRVKWRDPAGKHKSETGFRTRREALDRKNEIEVALRRGMYIDPRQGAECYRSVAVAWLDSKRPSLKARTLTGYESLLKAEKDIDKTFGGYPVNAITRQQVQDWVNRLTRAGKRPSTTRNAYFVVRQVLAQAVVDGRIGSNPCEHVTLPTARSAGDIEDRARFLTAEQVERLADCTPWPYRLAVLLPAHCGGLRAGELAGLQIRDVDLRREELHVRRTVIDLNGKLVYDTPKTRESRRTVPMPLDDEMSVYLTTHPRRNEPEAPLCPWAGRGKDPEVDWTRPMRHGTFYAGTFKEALRAADLSGVRYHDLRHTFASLRAQEGWSAQQVAEWMGHANVVTTLSIYTHLFRPDADDTLKKLKAARSATRFVDASNVVPMRREH